MMKKAKASPPKETAKEKLLTPVPVRLNPQQASQLLELERRTGFNRATLLRAGLSYVLPRILSGEVSLLDA